MTLRRYQIIKIVFVIVLAVIFSQAIIFKNILIPIALMVLSSLILLLLRRKVSDVVADERDYATGGKAALMTIQIYGWLAAISMFFFYGFRDYNPAYEPIGLTLAFSTCILMIVYGLIFRYYSRIKFSDKKYVYAIIVFIIFTLLAIFSLRLFSGEDDWVCEKGQWIKHGHPSFSAPKVECK